MLCNGHLAFGLLPCLLVHLLLAAPVSGAAPMTEQDTDVAKATCSLVIQGHSAGDVQPLRFGDYIKWAPDTTVSLACTPPYVVSVMVPNTSWLAPYTKNFSGVKLVTPEECAWQANMSSSGNNSDTQYCAMSVCGGNTSKLHVEFNSSLIWSNMFNGSHLASHPYLLCFQGLADVTFVSAVVLSNQYIASGGANNRSISSNFMAVGSDTVFKCIDCTFVQNVGARQSGNGIGIHSVTYRIFCFRQKAFTSFALRYSTSVMLPCRDPPGRFALRYSTSVMPSCCHAVTLLAGFALRYSTSVMPSCCHAVVTSLAGLL